MCNHAQSYLDSEDDRTPVDCDNCGTLTCHWCYVIVTVNEGKYDGCSFCDKYGPSIHNFTEFICQDCLDSLPNKWKGFRIETP